ncbi:hypothetical protein SRHO_G00229710 [Serrasalmus rhombeus]
MASCLLSTCGCQHEVHFHKRPLEGAEPLNHNTPAAVHRTPLPQPGEWLPLMRLKTGNGVQNTAVLRILKYLQSDKEGSKRGVEN